MDCGALSIAEQHWLNILVFVAYAFFERWLGRTDKTKSASTLDLIQSSVQKLFGIKTPKTLVVKEGEPKEGPKS